MHIVNVFPCSRLTPSTSKRYQHQNQEGQDAWVYWPPVSATVYTPQDTESGHRSRAAGLVVNFIGAHVPRRVNPVPRVDFTLPTAVLNTGFASCFGRTERHCGCETREGFQVRGTSLEVSLILARPPPGKTDTAGQLQGSTRPRTRICEYEYDPTDLKAFVGDNPPLSNFRWDKTWVKW